jgi:hypothetical protein
MKTLKKGDFLMKYSTICLIPLLLIAFGCSHTYANVKPDNCSTPNFELLHLRKSNRHVKLFQFQNKGGQGLIDEAGKVIVSPRFRKIDDFFENRAIFRDNTGKYGYLNPEGNIAIPAQFAQVQRFNEGLAAVELNKKWGYVDLHGRFVISPQFTWADPFYENRAFVSTTASRYGVIDQNGVWLTPEKVKMKSAFVDGAALVLYEGEKTDKFGLLDHTGVFTEFPNIDSSSSSYSFKNGLWPAYRVAMSQAKHQDTTETYINALFGRGKYGFIDKQGNFVISPHFHEVADFQFCAASVRVNEEWGLIDLNGEFILKPKFKYEPEYLGRGLVKILVDRKSVDKTVSMFIDGVKHEGRRSISTSKYRLMDFNGRWLTPAYEHIGGVSEDMIVFRTNEKYGFMDITGKVIIDAKFDEAYDFRDNRAEIRINGETRYIDHVGKYIWRPNLGDF